MKVYAYNPITGKRGEYIEQRECASFTDESANHAISQGKMKDLHWVTGNFGNDSEVTIHVDAGISGRDGKSVSYVGDEWICFCVGQWFIGQQAPVWQWVVLPSRQAIESAIN
ncbi:MAG: hypothetical protein ACRCXB_30160 [Aeromonadaceae bacterium]